MARLEKQESAEYYQWLFKIERTEFEKELLEIISILPIYFWSFSQPIVRIQKMLLIGATYHKLSFRVSNGYCIHRMRSHKS